MGLIKPVFLCIEFWIGTDFLNNFIQPYTQSTSSNAFLLPLSPETTPLMCRETCCWHQHSEMRIKTQECKRSKFVPTFINENTTKASDKCGNVKLLKKKNANICSYIPVHISAFLLPTSLFVSESYRNLARGTQLLLYSVKRMGMFFKSTLNKS